MFLTYGYGCLPVRVRISPYGYPYPYELPALGVFTAGNSWGFQRHVFLLALQWGPVQVSVRTAGEWFSPYGYPYPYELPGCWATFSLKWPLRFVRSYGH